jgi:hypothetical protein
MNVRPPFIEIDYVDKRLKLAQALVGDDVHLLGDTPEEAGALVLSFARACDVEAGGDERHVSNGYLLLRDGGMSNRIIMAVDVLRISKRTRH